MTSAAIDAAERAPVPTAPLDLSRPRRLHVVGVGGPGMSAIAIALAEMGHTVSGSDRREQPVLDRVRAAGVDVHIGHDRDLVRSVDAVTASTAIPADNIELDEGRRTGVPVLTRAGMLASICARARSIAVAGTHGKTTTSSMLMLILAEAGLDPGFVIGGDVRDVGTGAAWTASDSGDGLFVVEADESDGTHLELPLHGTIVTNVDVDHLDHYGSFDAVVDGFDRYLAQIPGPKVVGVDSDQTRRLAARHGTTTFGFGDDVDVRATVVEVTPGRCSFALDRLAGDDVEPLGTIELPLRGRHNVANATAAAVMAMELGVEFDAIATALGRFGGVARRFDVRGADGGATFVDDYAHLPTEIRAVLAAARGSGDGWSRVIAVFQPNRYHRIAEMWRDYADAFVDADVVVLTDVYASGTTPIPGVTGKLIVDAVTEAHPDQRVVWLPRRDDVVSFVASTAGDGDVVISMGCGDIESLPDEVLTARGATDGRSAAASASAPTGPRPVPADPIAAAAAELGDLAELDVPLGPMTTYRVGGAADVFVRLGSLDDVERVAAAHRASGLPVLLVGRGSNMLVADRGYRGIAVSATDLTDHIEIDAETSSVLAGGGVLLPVLARRTAAASLTGFEWAVGVPGSVGGAVRMNAGGHGSDMAATLVDVVVADVTAPDRAVRTVPAADLGLRFRGSDLGPGDLVVEARLQLAPGDREASEREISEIVAWRREHQPGGQNAGSVFVNPVPGEVSAGEVIDGLGLRGLRIGTASVSEKHANFVQADDGGSAADVVAVIEHVRAAVAEATGYHLRTEIRLIGFDRRADEVVRDG